MLQVEGPWQRLALLVYHLLLALFAVYCVRLLTQAVRSRKRLPMSLEVVRNANWTLPKMVRAGPVMHELCSSSHQPRQRMMSRPG